MSKKSHPGIWAIVMGPRDAQIIPLPLRQFVQTRDKARVLAACKAAHPGRIVRIIKQPARDGLRTFKEGM